MLISKMTVGAFRSNSKVGISLCHALKLAESGVSAAAESQLSPFLVRRPWPKHTIFHFAAFGRGRNSVFAVFYSSAMAENRFPSFSRFRPCPTNAFLPLFLFHPWMMNSFSRFLIFIRG